MDSVYRSLLPVFAAAMLGALLTDIAYWRSAEMMWADFSAWLLAAALIAGVLALIAGLITLFRLPAPDRHGMVWLHGAAFLLAFVLGILNLLIHSRDAWTSVVPTGLTLSAISVIVLIVAASAAFARGGTRPLGATAP